jgi:hypothetical protein
MWFFLSLVILSMFTGKKKKRRSSGGGLRGRRR